MSRATKLSKAEKRQRRYASSARQWRQKKEKVLTSCRHCVAFAKLRGGAVVVESVCTMTARFDRGNSVSGVKPLDVKGAVYCAARNGNGECARKRLFAWTPWRIRRFIQRSWQRKAVSAVSG